MQCPSCNKLCGFEITDPELDSLDAENGTVTGSVRLVLTTACCGDEAKENTFDIELDLTDNLLDALKVAGVAEPDLELDGVEFEVVSKDATADERYETKDRKGKTITNPRYMKKFYTVEVTVTVKATYPVPDGDPIKVEVEGTWTDEVQASEMEELC